MSHGGDNFEQRLAEAAKAFDYPPTPDLAARLRDLPVSHPRRPAVATPRLAWALATLLLVLAGLLVVPESRAAILRILRIGSIEVVLPTPTAVPPAATDSPAPTTMIGTPTGTPRIVLPDLAGATNLRDAQRRAGFAIKLPAYPPDLGPPDRVFLQFVDGPMVILLWLDDANQPEIALYQITSDVLARKLGPRLVEETTVNDRPAIWIEGPHLLQFRGGAGVREGQIVAGNVLVWEADGITYRLESGLGLDEARQIAASIP
jgi:hypothetical protein